MQHLYSVPSLAELRQVMPGSASAVMVLGHTQPGDGGAGVFYWNSTSRKVDDDGSVVAGDEPVGRWERAVTGCWDIRAFGATSGRDATAAIQRALDAAAGGGSVYVPRGAFRVSRPLRVPQGVLLHGDGLFSELHYSGPAKSGCLQVAGDAVSSALGVSRINISVLSSGAWGIDLRRISYSRFDHVTIHLRQPQTAGFHGPGNGASPYYNVFVACHVAGVADHARSGCIGFDFPSDEPNQLQSANANQIYGGRVSSCQVAVRCLGTGNVFHGQVLESNDVGYEFDLCPARKTQAQRGTINDVFGCYNEWVRIPIRQSHPDCYVTAQLTMVTGYERIFEAIATRNCIVLSPHDDVDPNSRSIIDRRLHFVSRDLPPALRPS